MNNHHNFPLFLAITVYCIIVLRWFYVINEYHNKVLFQDTTYAYKDHPIFKGVLYGRAIFLASIGPLIGMVKPSYFSSLLEGIELATVNAKVNSA